MIKKAQLFKQDWGGGWVVGGTHQQVYFAEIKIYAHKQSGEEVGVGGEGGGNQLSEREHFTTIRLLDGKSGKSTLKAAVMASICVQHDRLVLINTFQKGTVPRQFKSMFAVKDAESNLY